jgi:hypothetical protein
MTRACRWLYAAGVLLLGLAGCQLTDFSVLAYLQGAGPDRVVAGSLETVSASYQDSLRELGLFTRASRDGDTVRITATKNEANGQKRFTLVLTRHKTEQGEQTRVRIEWENGADAALEAHLLSRAEVKSPH